VSLGKLGVDRKSVLRELLLALKPSGRRVNVAIVVAFDPRQTRKGEWVIRVGLQCLLECSTRGFEFFWTVMIRQQGSTT